MFRIHSQMTMAAGCAGATLCAFAAFHAFAAPTASPTSIQASLESSFDAGIDPDEMRHWLRQMSSEPNHVGSPHDKANAEWELAQFKKFGWQAHIETFEVLYPTPISESVELLGAQPHQAALQERPSREIRARPPRTRRCRRIWHFREMAMSPLLWCMSTTACRTITRRSSAWVSASAERSSSRAMAVVSVD